MDRTELAQLRDDLGLTQQQMADEIGLSRRGYIDIETGVTPMRKLHQLAAERVALAFAARNAPTLTPAAMQVMGDSCPAWLRLLRQDAFGWYAGMHVPDQVSRVTRERQR